MSASRQFIVARISFDGERRIICGNEPCSSLTLG